MKQTHDRSRVTLLSCIAITLTLLLALNAKEARAVAPTNDLFPNAVVVPGLPFSDVVDTTEATTDADDVQLNDPFFCGAPATDASVWYAFTVDSDSDILIDVSGSNYSAGILVGTGTQGNLSIVACGPGVVLFPATAGTTYYVLAIDDQLDGGGNGGTLSINISVFVPPPPPTLEFTVDRFGQFNSKSGTATISGTYTCTDGDYFSVDGSASQSVGRIATIIGFLGYSAFGTCDGTPQTWSAEVFPQSGKFKGGKALALTFAITCGFECASTDGYIQHTVQLKGGSGGAKAAGAEQFGNHVFIPFTSTQ
jgi:hypothetical protein